MVHIWYGTDCAFKSVSSVSSTAGSDFSDPGLAMLTFGSGVTSQSLPITILDDEFIEDDEFFLALLTTDESNVNVVNETAIINILDTDSE